ncbi:hypothetical protein NDU88_004885 [Pleurodeles waltl]|uniref:Uncharacterized protein n=1 Tax=Pleurodeles waltl TaxID=8319 RepID=A0AAV7NNL3_PLEWA|nr:hypothetical protein NDU88_004885 [Pleurodeles waltl]
MSPVGSRPSPHALARSPSGAAPPLQGRRHAPLPRSAAPAVVFGPFRAPLFLQGPGAGPRHSPHLSGSNPGRRLQRCRAQALRGLPVTTGLLRPSEDWVRPHTFRFFTRRQPPGSGVSSSERAPWGLSVVFSPSPALGVSPPPHARPRLQARGQAASLSRGRQPGPGTARPQRRPSRFQGRPPIPQSHLGTGLPGDGAHSLWIYVGPSGARGLSVRHLRIVGHAPLEFIAFSQSNLGRLADGGFQ